MNEFARNGSRPALSPGETILWQAKPNKRAFILNWTVLPIPVVIAITAFIYFVQFRGKIVWQWPSSPIFILPILVQWFFLLGPTAVWLFCLLTASAQWKQTEYYATNRRLIKKSGVIRHNNTSLFYKDLKNVSMRISFIDQLFNAGTVIFHGGTDIVSGRSHSRAYIFSNLDNPRQAYEKLQKIIIDIQTDIEFPNAMRPEENPGYSTDYRE